MGKSLFFFQVVIVVCQMDGRGCDVCGVYDASVIKMHEAGRCGGRGGWSGEKNKGPH